MSRMKIIKNRRMSRNKTKRRNINKNKDKDKLNKLNKMIIKKVNKKEIIDLDNKSQECKKIIKSLQRTKTNNL